MACQGVWRTTHQNHWNLYDLSHSAPIQSFVEDWVFYHDCFLGIIGGTAAFYLFFEFGMDEFDCLWWCGDFLDESQDMFGTISIGGVRWEGGGGGGTNLCIQMEKWNDYMHRYIDKCNSSITEREEGRRCHRIYWKKSFSGRCGSGEEKACDLQGRAGY